MPIRNCSLIAFGFLLIAAPASADFKVGAILPLSGFAAEGGTACRDGALLAVETLPAEERNGFQVIFEDNSFSTSKAVSAAQKLMSQDKVNALITWESGSSNAIAPIAEAAQIPLVTTSLDPQIVRGRSYAFNYWVTPESQAQKMVVHAVQVGHKRIARVTAQQDGLIAVKASFDAANSRRLLVAFDEMLDPEEKDFRSLVARIRTNPEIDGVAVLLLMNQTGLFAKQARQGGLTIPLFGVETFEDRSQVILSEGALIDQWYVQAGDPQHWFVKQFTGRFPHSALYSAANCYDIVRLLSRGRMETMNLQTFLSSVHDYTGALGRVSSTGDNRFTLSAVVKRITADGFRTVDAVP